MADLRTSYMGLQLRNPIIVASSPLTATVDSLVACEKAGAGAVVVKSIFEEQISAEALRDTSRNCEYLAVSDFEDVFNKISKDYYFDQYLKLVQKAKSKLSIPVIASINCSNVSSWTEYAKRFESVGADALELNYYPIASNAAVTGDKVDKRALAFARESRSATKLPLSIKISSQYSSLANIIRSFGREGIDALVLFNRFYRPDIDINRLEVCGMHAYSEPSEYADSLRWIALMAAETKNIDFAGSTGIHNAETVIKMLLAGAKATELCTVLMRNGLDTISSILSEVGAWMDRKGFSSVSEFQGRLAQENMLDGAHWERSQYMMTLHNS